MTLQEVEQMHRYFVLLDQTIASGRISVAHESVQEMQAKFRGMQAKFRGMLAEREARRPATLEPADGA